MRRFPLALALLAAALAAAALPAFAAPPAYLDDRSTAAALVRSFYNAVNRREYARAYSYFGDHAAQPYAGFAAGYADTVSVSVVDRPGASGRRRGEYVLHPARRHRGAAEQWQPQAVRRMLHAAAGRSGDPGSAGDADVYRQRQPARGAGRHPPASAGLPPGLRLPPLRRNADMQLS